MDSLGAHLTGLSQAVNTTESKSVCVGSKPVKDEIASDHQSQNLFLLECAGLKPANDKIHFFLMQPHLDICSSELCLAMWSS
jgi:hypothetical protein